MIPKWMKYWDRRINRGAAPADCRAVEEVDGFMVDGLAKSLQFLWSFRFAIPENAGIR
jgi:hypothetical protein